MNSKKFAKEAITVMKNPSCEKWREGMMFLLLATFDISIIYVAAESTGVVQTTFGPVQGEILSTPNSVKYAAFKGIRYAKPPIGNLRFKPPVPADPWTETFSATVEGADCAQDEPSLKNMSEDCLFLNVFTPVTNFETIPTKLKSVMVWFYGGSFAFGSSLETNHNPRYIIEKDVVFVSMNYRLAAFGFLSLDHPDATGNAGLKDQVLALKWVQSNIEKFGGNPNNVTIFGQSAGAAAVGYHVLSSASTGLFHGAISMSGSPLNPWALVKPADALIRAQNFSTILGTTSTNKTVLLDTFYRATMTELVEASSALAGLLSSIPFLPTLEDKTIATDPFLSTCSLTKYTTGDYNKVPQIMGFMDDETLVYFGDKGLFALTLDYITKFADSMGVPVPASIGTTKRQIASGIDSFDKLPASLQNSLLADGRNFFFEIGIEQTQRLLAANNGKPIYYYHVSFTNERSFHKIIDKINRPGPGHGDDRPYIFYEPRVDNSADRSTDPVALTIDRYSTMWTNFAKYGDPTPSWLTDNNKLNVAWPDSRLSGSILNIGNELVVEPRTLAVSARHLLLISQSFVGETFGCNSP